MTVSTAVYNLLTDFLVCFPLLCYEGSSPALLKESLVLAWAWEGGLSWIPGSLRLHLNSCGFGCSNVGLFLGLRTLGWASWAVHSVGLMGTSRQVWSSLSAVVPTEASWSGNPLPYRQQTCIIALFRRRAEHSASLACLMQEERATSAASHHSNVVSGPWPEEGDTAPGALLQVAWPRELDRTPLKWSHLGSQLLFQEINSSTRCWFRSGKQCGRSPLILFCHEINCCHVLLYL